MVVYENKLWIFGGLEHNDVWSSTNGKDWQKVFDPAPWSTRGAEHSVAFRNAIWIFAGKTGRDDSWDESGDVWRMRTVPGAETSFKSRRIDISIPGFWKILFFLF
jgi:hypothetical protein